MAACAALTALAALYTAFAAPISIARDQEDLLSSSVSHPWPQ
jgi:hypothetical protein